MLGFIRDRQKANDKNAVLVARRMIRSDESEWERTRSCLGGRPPVDHATWPRRMHCIAQLDLSEIAAQEAVVPYSLPDTGLLVFFADTGSFSGSNHRGGVCYVPNEDLEKEHELPMLPPVYGQDWDSYDLTAGSISWADAPTIFPRWPIECNVAHQSGEGIDMFTPDLETLLGEEASSVHLDLSEYAPLSHEADGSSLNGDIWPYPAQAASAIIRDLLRIALEYRNSKPKPNQDVVASVIDHVRGSAEIVNRIVDRAEYWQSILSTLDAYRPLDEHLAQAFAIDLRSLKGRFRKDNKRMRFGSGTTVTRSAALSSYFEMYCGSRRAFDSLPDVIRRQIETTRMRSAYGSSSPHQLFGFGTNPQESDMIERGMVLLFQAATDEAVGFMWGDVGVLQYWISPEDLAERRWDKVEFIMDGH